MKILMRRIKANLTVYESTKTLTLFQNQLSILTLLGLVSSFYPQTIGRYHLVKLRNRRFHREKFLSEAKYLQSLKKRHQGQENPQVLPCKANMETQAFQREQSKIIKNHRASLYVYVTFKPKRNNDYP